MQAIKVSESKKKVGRPPKFTDPAEIDRLANEYFDEQDAKEKPYTTTGLARHLGMTRTGLLNYGEKQEFASTIKKHKCRVEEYAEMHLFGKTQVAGAIFNLKNNHGWVDRQEISQSIDVNINARLNKAIENVKDINSLGGGDTLTLDAESVEVIEQQQNDGVFNAVENSKDFNNLPKLSGYKKNDSDIFE